MAQSATEFDRGAAPVAAERGEEPEGPGAIARKPRQIFWDRFKQDKLALFGAVLVILMVVLAAAAPLAEALTGHQLDEQFREDMLNEFGTPQGPDFATDFYFGGDDLGRDLFVRVLYGGRVSLKVAIVATGLEVVIGVMLGMLAGYMRGWIDTGIARLVDLILSIPFLLLGITLSVTLGEQIENLPLIRLIGQDGQALVLLLIILFGWPYIARIVRGQTLSLRESQFIEAAHSIGAPTRWIMFREMLPNLVAPVVVYATLLIPINIIAEAALSFLGVGIQEPTPAWGTMLARSRDYVIYGAAWWYMVFPGLFLFMTVLGFNLLGDGLRDALDPKTAR